MLKKDKYNESYMEYNNENNSNNSEDSKDNNIKNNFISTYKRAGGGNLDDRLIRLKNAGNEVIQGGQPGYHNMVDKYTDKLIIKGNKNKLLKPIQTKGSKNKKEEVSEIEQEENIKKKQSKQTTQKKVSQIAKEEDIFKEEQLELSNDIKNFLTEYHEDNTKDMERYINGINLTYALIYNLAKNKGMANQAKGFNYRITKFKPSEYSPDADIKPAMKIFFSKGEHTYEAIYCRDENNQLIIKTDHLHPNGQYLEKNQWKKIPKHYNLVNGNGQILLKLFPTDSDVKENNAKANKNNDQQYDLPNNAEKLLNNDKIMDLLLPENLKEKFKEIQEFINKIKEGLSSAESKNDLDHIERVQTYFNDNKDDVFKNTNKNYKNKKCNYLQNLIDHTKAMLMLKNIKGNDPKKNKKENETVNKIEEEFKKRHKSGWYKNFPEKEEEMLEEIRKAKLRLNKEQRELEEHKNKFIKEILYAENLAKLQSIWNEVKKDTKLNDNKNSKLLDEIKEVFHNKARVEIHNSKDFKELSGTEIHSIILDNAVKTYISNPTNKAKEDMSNIIKHLVTKMYNFRQKTKDNKNNDNFYKIMYDCRTVMHKYIDQLKNKLKPNKNHEQENDKINIINVVPNNDNKDLPQKIDILEQYDTILTVCQYSFKAQTNLAGGQAYKTKTTDGEKNIYQDARIELLLALFKLQNNVVTEETVKSIWFDLSDDIKKANEKADRLYTKDFINNFIRHQVLYDNKNRDQDHENLYHDFEKKMLRCFTPQKSQNIEERFEKFKKEIEKKDNTYKKYGYKADKRNVIAFLELPIYYRDQIKETIDTMLEKAQKDLASNYNGLLSERVEDLENNTNIKEKPLSVLIKQTKYGLEKRYYNFMLRLINDYTPEIIDIYDDKQINSEKAKDNNKKESLMQQLVIKNNKTRNVKNNKNNSQEDNSESIKNKIEELSKNPKDLLSMIDFACQCAWVLLTQNEKHDKNDLTEDEKKMIRAYDKMICGILYSGNIFISNKIAKLKSEICKLEQLQCSDKLETSKKQLKKYESISEQMQSKLKLILEKIKNLNKSADLLCSNIPFLIKDITDEELQSDNIKNKINTLKDSEQINSDKVTYSRNVLPVIHQLNIGHDGKNRNGNAANKKNNDTNKCLILPQVNNPINNEDNKKEALKREVDNFIKNNGAIQKYLNLDVVKKYEKKINELKEIIALLYQILKYQYKSDKTAKQILSESIVFNDKNDENKNRLKFIYNLDSYLQTKNNHFCLYLDIDPAYNNIKEKYSQYISKMQKDNKLIEDLYTAPLKNNKKDVKYGAEYDLKNGKLPPINNLIG